jgi:hypothetical protein
MVASVLWASDPDTIWLPVTYFDLHADNSFDFFFAERQCCGSKITITTNLLRPIRKLR